MTKKLYYTFEEIMKRRGDNYEPMPPTDHDCHMYGVFTWWDLLDVHRYLGYTHTSKDLTESYGPNRSLGICDFDHLQRIVTFLSPESTSSSKTAIPFPSEKYGDGLQRFLYQGPFEHPHLYGAINADNTVRVPTENIYCYSVGQSVEHDDNMRIMFIDRDTGLVGIGPPV